jgi:hypothetical protein
MFTLTINLGNAAMQTPDDVARALAVVASRVVRCYSGLDGDVGKVWDDNGNTVGQWEYKPAE